MLDFFTITKAETMNVNPPTSYSLILKRQELPAGHPDCQLMFNPANTQFVATAGAVEQFGEAVLKQCLARLTMRATEQCGLDYLQVFETDDRGSLWFIERDEVITALLPSEY